MDRDAMDRTLKDMPPRRLRTVRRRLGALGIAVVALLAAGVVGAAVAEAYQQTWVMNMTGRGYGHGVGMSQYGAQGFAKRGKSYKDILRHYYRGISFGSTSDRTVRILLTSKQSPVKVTSASSFTARVGSSTKTIGGGVTASVTRSSGKFKLVAGGQSWTSSSAIEFKPGSSKLRLVNRNLNGWSTTANALYRGRLVVSYSSTFGLCTINKVALESYLYGVVPREMPSSWHQQALRAQAVAARTYAAKRIGASGLFDLYCDTRSQAYSGASGEASATNSAVNATRGVVAKYNGSLIDAFYFSTSGGETENCENVFWATLPYLKGVDDPYDYESPYHKWPDNPLRWSGPTMRSRIGSGNVPSGGLQAVYVVQRGASPRVRTALTVSASGAKAVSGATLRARLGLRDTWFSVRSMSFIPGEGVTIANGARFELRGRTYPALSSTAKLKLYYYRNGAWHWLYVPADNIERHTRKVTAGGKTYTLTYSTYSYRIRPPKTTTYRFVTGSSRSPKAKVTVKGTAPAPTPAPSPSPTPTPTPTPSPSPSPSELTVEPGDFFTIATRDFRINRGWVAKYRYEVLFGPQAGETDEGVTADVTLKVRDSGGKSRMTKEFSAVPVNTSQTYEARCWLAPGYYDYYIYATLPDGTTQQSVGKGHFVVRYEDGTMPPAAATTPSPTPSASPTATPSPSPSASPSPSPSPSDTTSPSPSPSTSPSASPSPSPSPTPEPSPSPTATEEPAAAEPRAAALATQVVYRGDTAALPVKVVRSEDGVADIVVRIRKEGSAKTVKTLVLDDCALDRTYKARFRCWLAKGRYRYYVWAVSPDGVWQTGPSSKPLVVR